MTDTQFETHNIINDPNKDPLGAMMLDYMYGDQDASAEVGSSTLDMSTMRGETMFREYAEMGPLEQKALQLCEGRILDVGAGSGCHSLFLQEHNKDVDALEISSGCIQVMRERKVHNPIHQNFFSLGSGKYRTILMLMNGLGICGSLDGFNLFLQYIRSLLTEGGQVIADSTDLSSLYEGTEEELSSSDIYYGETEFVIRYQNITSDPFKWLYIDFSRAQALVEFNGLQCQQIMTGQAGRYLLRIY